LVGEGVQSSGDLLTISCNDFMRLELVLNWKTPFLYFRAFAFGVSPESPECVVEKAMTESKIQSPLCLA